MAAKKMSLKLFIDTKGNKVLFGEAGKDFVDFLAYLLALPMGTIAKLLLERSICGSLNNLYKSVENLSETYFQQNQNKNSVLNPKSQLHATEMPLLQSYFDSQTNPQNTPLKYYSCCHDYNCGNPLYVSDVPNLSCPSCKSKMNNELYYFSPEFSITLTVAGDSRKKNKNQKGKMRRYSRANAYTAPAKLVKSIRRVLVKEVVMTYMVMDNLEVMPMTAFSCTSMLNKFNVKDVGALEEKVVDFGSEEALKLLKASMECKNALTSVFFGVET